ncbi:MAG: T9SS type A sorting domain-containing protein [Candidatus Eisenbacteria bacterium]
MQGVQRSARWLVLGAAIGLCSAVSAPDAAAQVPIWVKLPPPAAIDLHVRDTRRDREIFLDEQGLVEVLDASSVEWQRIWTGANPPVSFDHHFAFYDPARDRIWVMSRFLSDTLKLWSLDLSADPLQWTLRPTVYSLAGTTIQSSSLGFDPTHDRVLAFGGFSAGGAINDVYTLSLSGTPQWSRAVVGGGSGPGPRASSIMGYDPWRDRMLIYGGLSFGPVVYDETWALSLDPPMTWTFLTPTQLPPSGRSPSIGVLDSLGQRWFIAGDQTYTLLGYSEAWALDLNPALPANQATWARMPADQNEAQPYILRGLWAQPTRSRMVAYDPDPYHPDNVWTLALGAAHWTLVGDGLLGLVRRQGPVAFVDPDSQRVYVGLGSNSSGSDTSFQSRPLDQDVPWTTLPTSGPSARASAVAVTDLAARRALVFGGSDYFNLAFEGSEFRDLWSFDLDTQAWTLLDPAGPMLARAAALGVFDPAHRKLIVRGGRYTNPGPVPLGDTWVYDAAAGSWSSYGGASYGSRWGEVGIYDPVRQQVVAFGGTSDGTNNFTDVHVLPLSPTVGTWSALATTGIPTGVGGTPNAVTAQTAAYDPIGDRMIITTGFGPNTEMWALTLGGTPTWSKLTPDGTAPPERFGLALVSDPARQRVLLVGGQAGTSGYTIPIDTWALYYDKSTPTLLALMSADATPEQVTLRWYAGATGILSARVDRRAAGEEWRVSGQALADGSGVITWIDRAVVPGATYDYRLGVSGSGGERLFGETRIVVPTRSMLSLEGMRPNPGSGPMLVSFSLATGGRASLELLDVTGRRRFEREVGSLGAGHHLLRLDDEGRVPAGLYFLRLTQDGRVQTSKVVIAR